MASEPSRLESDGATGYGPVRAVLCDGETTTCDYV